MQPGDTITPDSSPEPAVHLAPEVVVSLNPAAPPTKLEANRPEDVPAVPVPEYTPPSPIQEAADTAPPPTWQFSGEAGTTAQQSDQPNPQEAEVAWSASEYVAHQKNITWFVGLGLVVAVVTIIVYLISHDVFSAVMIALLGVGFGVFASRQPRVLDYKVNSHGITIGAKFYTYESFKTFSITRDGVVNYVVLAPLQRFSPALTVYYDPQDEDKIIDVLGSYLPFAEAKPDAVDSLMRRVRF